MKRLIEGAKRFYKLDIGDSIQYRGIPEMIENNSGYRDPSMAIDCLKATGVFKRWKTLLLLVVAICLGVQQMSFYLLDQGYIQVNDQAHSDGLHDGNQPKEANPVLQFLTKWLPADSMNKMTFDQLAWTINLINFVLIFAAATYCLTLLLSLKVSLQGNLGGIKHITRAFILSLLMLVLLLPWQKMFGGIVMGAVFTPHELLDGYLSKTENMVDSVLYYFRFGGYGLSILLLLILSYLASLFWARAIVRRIKIAEVELDWGL